MGFGFASPTRSEVPLQKKLTDDEFGTVVVLGDRIKSVVAVRQIQKVVCKKGKHGFRD